MKIYAPVKDANGIYASVRFVNGVGETDDPRLIEWFRSRGYKLSGNFTTTEPNDEIKSQDDKVVETDHFPDTTKMVEEPEMMGYSEPDFESMTPLELREYMIEHGYNVRNTRNKEKLLEILRG